MATRSLLKMVRPPGSGRNGCTALSVALLGAPSAITGASTSREQKGLLSHDQLLVTMRANES